MKKYNDEYKVFEQYGFSFEAYDNLRKLSKMVDIKEYMKGIDRILCYSIDSISDDIPLSYAYRISLPIVEALYNYLIMPYESSYITTDSGKSTSIEITVLKTAERLELDKTSLSLEAGQAENLTVTMTPVDAADKLNWSSSNTAVATVDGNGKVTAAGVGTAVITVTAAYSGVSATCTVEVVGDVTITASGEVSVKSNAKTTFAIIPDYGYVVKDVQVNGASVGAVESYTFSNPKENATIHADFAAVNVSYENGDVVISSEAALNNLKLIVAEYNDDNSLANCEIKNVTAEAGVEYHASASPAGKYKIMLWSSFDTMRPMWMSASV